MNYAHLFQEKRIELTIDGIFYSVKINYLDPSDISVSIEQPDCFKGDIIHSPHIPYFAMPIKKNWFFINGKITQRAIKNMEDGIRRFHEVHRIFKENNEKIKDAFLKIKIINILRNKDIPKITYSVLLAKKKELKKRLKVKEISEKDYALKLNKQKEYYRNYQNFNLQIESDLSDYLKNKYNIYLNYDEKNYFVNFYFGLNDSFKGRKSE